MLSPETRKALLSRGQTVAKCLTVASVAGYALVKVGATKINELIDAYQAEKTADDMYTAHPIPHVGLCGRIVGHFERVRREAKELSASFLPELAELLNRRYHIDELMQRLQAEHLDDLSADDARTERLKIWNEIKLEVVSKVVASVYATSLLSLLVSTLMAVIGRWVYLKDVIERGGLVPDSFITGLAEIPTVGKALMTICTHFVVNGVETIDEAVMQATKLVLGRVDVQTQVSRTELEDAVRSIRHEIEDAAGRDVVDETLLGHDTLSDAFSLLPKHSQRSLANRILADTKSTLASPLFKHVLSRAVQSRIDTLLARACQELYAAYDQPLLLSLVPAINAEYQLLMTPKLLVQDDGLLAALMASVFRSANVKHK